MITDLGWKKWKSWVTSGPRREKTCLRSLWKSDFQTGLLRYTDWLENWNFTCRKLKCDTFHQANNKGADQAARMRRLVCVCVVRKPPKTGFLSRQGPSNRAFNQHYIWPNAYAVLEQNWARGGMMAEYFLMAWLKQCKPDHDRPVAIGYIF